MKLKDADAIREQIASLRVIVTGVRSGKGLLCELMTEYRNNILQAIDNAPTIDAVPVVRCAECWKSADGLCSYQLKNVPGKDFCGDGERRSDG